MSSDPSHHGSRWNDGDDGTARFGPRRNAWPRKSAADQPLPMPEDWEPETTEADRREIRREQAEAVSGDPLRWRASRG